MITDADIKKMKAVFTTKEDLKVLELRMATKDDLIILRKEFIEKFATKDDLKRFATKNEMSLGFQELVKFIGEVKIDIMRELNDFRDEMRDINRNSQSTVNNLESRITHLEYNKS